MPAQEQQQIVRRLMDLLQKEDFRSARILLDLWERRMRPTEVLNPRQQDGFKGQDDEVSASAKNRDD